MCVCVWVYTHIYMYVHMHIQKKKRIIENTHSEQFSTKLNIQEKYKLYFAAADFEDSPDLHCSLSYYGLSSLSHSYNRNLFNHD